MLLYEIYIVNNTFRVFFHTVCASHNIFVKNNRGNRKRNYNHTENVTCNCLNYGYKLSKICSITDYC